jgi:hypothetical protein
VCELWYYHFYSLLSNCYIIEAVISIPILSKLMACVCVYVSECTINSLLVVIKLLSTVIQEP